MTVIHSKFKIERKNKIGKFVCYFAADWLSVFNCKKNNLIITNFIFNHDTLTIHGIIYRGTFCNKNKIVLNYPSPFGHLILNWNLLVRDLG